MRLFRSVFCIGKVEQGLRGRLSIGTVRLRTTQTKKPVLERQSKRYGHIRAGPCNLFSVGFSNNCAQSGNCFSVACGGNVRGFSARESVSLKEWQMSEATPSSLTIALHVEGMTSTKYAAETT